MGNGKLWLHGLIAAFIGGGAGSISSGFGAILTDPEHFNPANGLRHLLVLMGVTFLVNAIISTAAYLKQSPCPPGWDGKDRRDGGK